MIGRTDRLQLANAAMGVIVNWLASLRLFLDHAQTDLSHRFGKDSPEIQRFKVVTAHAFDTKPGYRFAYKFRNYVQHCGLLLSSIQAVRPDRAVEGGPKQVVHLVLSREALLNDFKEWGPVKHDLLQLPDEFPLLPLAHEAMAGVREIYSVLLDIEVAEALQVCELLRAQIETIRVHDAGAGWPTLFKLIEVDSDNVTFSTQLLPVEAIDALCEVTSGKASRGSLLRDPEPHRQPWLDPAEVQARFHRDSRGVQALTTWLVEQGGTERFHDRVNQIIEEDRDIEPLITGLLNVSATLLHVSSGALGTTPEGMMTGLIAMYGEYVAEPTDPDTS